MMHDTGKKSKPIPPRAERARFWISVRRAVRERDGITLLLVIVLLSTILSISVGIFNVVIGEFRISGEATDSFRALYAADQGIERTLYRDRVQQALCTVVEGPDCFVASDVSVLSDACYTVRVSKLSGATAIAIAGQYRCGTSPSRVVKRGFEVTY
jgi:Tfp pilus assembly protein PilX